MMNAVNTNAGSDAGIQDAWQMLGMGGATCIVQHTYRHLEMQQQLVQGSKTSISEQSTADEALPTRVRTAASCCSIGHVRFIVEVEVNATRVRRRHAAAAAAAQRYWHDAVDIRQKNRHADTYKR